VSAGAGRSGLLLVLALAGATISAYLALFELGVLSAVWDPLFAYGSAEVLRSAPARAIPVPDAVLGVVGYATEAVLLVGAQVTGPRLARRLTIVLGALAAVMALTGLTLVALQAFVVHAWCALCLASAVISWTIALIAIPHALVLHRSPAPRQQPSGSRAAHPSHH
jgi:uncharacterized membrane protein